MYNSSFYTRTLFFCHFTYAIKLEADAKIAIAFLVAHVLDLVRNAGREFEKYSRGVRWISRDPGYPVQGYMLLEGRSSYQCVLVSCRLCPLSRACSPPTIAVTIRQTNGLSTTASGAYSI